MDPSNNALHSIGWALERADIGSHCCRCRCTEDIEGVRLVKITFRAGNGVNILGPWGVHFCLDCLVNAAKSNLTQRPNIPCAM